MNVKFWMILTIVLAVVFAITLFLFFGGSAATRIFGGTLSTTNAIPPTQFQQGSYATTLPPNMGLADGTQCTAAQKVVWWYDTVKQTYVYGGAFDVCAQSTRY